MSSNNNEQLDLSGLTQAQRDGLVVLERQLKTIIGAIESDIYKNLTPAVRKRVAVLRDIQREHDELEAKFFEERAALEAKKSEHDELEAKFFEERTALDAKYQKLYAPLYLKRYDIVTGAVEVDGAKEEGALDKTDDTEKGVPDFWLTAMKNNEITTEEITERDEEALKYLKNIKWCRMDDPKGFKLEFFFETNPFFTNSVLTKVYHMIDDDEPILEKAIGTTIEWLPGKCLTQKILKIKPKKGSKKAKPIIKTKDCLNFSQISKKKKNMSSDLAISFSVVLVFLELISYVRAQSPSPPGAYPYASFNPSIITIIIILVAALFLMGFFSIYIRRRANENGGSIRRAFSMRRTVAAPRGLDSSVIETFPTFVYSSVKGLKIGKGALECAVCLNEYEDEETLRLIPKCDHVFHPECIDAWFENHVTCPVCRANLVPGPEQDSQESGTGASDVELGVVNDEHQSTTTGNDDIISVVTEDPVVNVQEPDTISREKSLKPRTIFPSFFGKFRSHSTGHSIVQPGENLDRFTLRLPQDIRKQVVNRALLNRTGSTVRMAGEGSAKKGYRTGGGAISGRRKSYKRLESLDRVVVRSERWVLSRAPSFLTRAFSIRSPRIVSGNGEASTSATTPKGSKSGDKVPLNNIGPKSC